MPPGSAELPEHLAGKVHGLDRRQLRVAEGEAREAHLDVAVEDLRRPGAHHVEMREAFGMTHRVHFYTLGRDVIWGASARILDELLSLPEAE